MNTIRISDNITIDLSAVRSIFSPDGLPQWAGKVAITIDGHEVTANWAGKEEQVEGKLCDFEGEPEDGDPIYAMCEENAKPWSDVVAKHLGRPSTWDARVVARQYTRSLCHA
jgi:hypothetical protein